MDLSVVIPVYNEETKIRHDIIAASNFLSSYDLSGEIIVVDDGSTDRSSETALGTTVDEGVSLKVIDYREHLGKGYAVKAGVLEAVGEKILFIDSGNCVPYANILRGLAILEDPECVIAQGSRFHPESRIKRSRKPYRRLASFLFRKYIRIHSRIPPGVTDTQCGLKIYEKHVARELFSECITDGFMFDIEIILRARKKGYCIREFPIEWSSDPDSRLSVRGSFFNIFSELRTIRKTLNKP